MIRRCAIATILAAVPTLLLATDGIAADTPRARDLGVPFQGEPGSLNAITDVAGVPVGVEIPEEPAYEELPSPAAEHDQGSIIAVVATDAPLLPHGRLRDVLRAFHRLVESPSTTSAGGGS